MPRRPHAPSNPSRSPGTRGRKRGGRPGQHLPAMLFSTADGQLLEHPFLKMAAHNGLDYVVPEPRDLTPIPRAWDVMGLPCTLPVGFDPESGRFEVVERVPGVRGAPLAPAIHPPPGFVRQFFPAAHYLPFTSTNQGGLKRVDEGGAPGRTGLPLWSYTALGWRGNSAVAAMFQADELSRWHPSLYYKPELPALVKERLAKEPDNEVLAQLGMCALDYKCCCAQNIFYQRWEGAVAIAPWCNAACMGCLSKDAEWDAPTPQKRLKFIPRAKDVGAVLAHHLLHAPEPMCSFGQGCEGEPTLSGDALCDGIATARGVTGQGIIHLNTNGSRPDVVARAASSGLDSLRVSVNTFDEDVFTAYYRPSGYSLEQLHQTLAVAREARLHSAINLLIWPGWTDTPAELHRLTALCEKGLLDMIQLRNLCLDPGHYNAILPAKRERPMGLRQLVEELHRRFPRLRFGTFNARLAAPWWKDVPPWFGAAPVES